MARFPVAVSVVEAMAPLAQLARTHAEAVQIAGARVELSTCVEFVTGPAWTLSEFLSDYEQGQLPGWVQQYETELASVAIAVTFWKIIPEKRAFKKRKKLKPTVSKQLELFGPPSQIGHERPDRSNSAVIIVEDEGTGRSFGA